MCIYAFTGTERILLRAVLVLSIQLWLFTAYAFANNETVTELNAAEIARRAGCGSCWFYRCRPETQ